MNGHSDHEIMAMGGPDTLKEVSGCTKGVRHKRLAEFAHYPKSVRRQKLLENVVSRRQKRAEKTNKVKTGPKLSNLTH